MRSFKIQSSLPILPISGLGKSGGIPKPVVKGVIYITKKNPILDLKMGGGIGGGVERRGGIEGGRGDCSVVFSKNIICCTTTVSRIGTHNKFTIPQV